MNALDLLKIDHRRIMTLFDQAENKVKSGSEAAEPFDDLARALHFHQTMLREVLYPALEEHNESALIASQTENDARLDQLIDNVESNQPADEDLSSRFGEMKDIWLNHAEQAEVRLFPAVERSLGTGRLLELLYEMDEIRSHQSGQDSAIYPASRLGPKV